MNVTFAGKFFGRHLLSQSIVTAFAAMSVVTASMAEPRDILPPWPEYTLGIWGFNESFLPMMPSRVAVGAESAQMADSWSGHALVRDAFTLSPVAVPVADPFYRKRNFTTTEGTIRFWFRPEWSGINAGGLGPRVFARLLELVTLTGKEPETLWSLYFNPEGDVIYLSGMGVGGATDFMKVEVKMTANRWHLISLNYDEKQTTLMVDAVVLATGAAMPPVASWKADALGLVIGSDIAGANPALGWFDELCTFEEVQPQADVLAYWKSLRWVAILGAVGTAKQEAVKQRWLEQLKLEVEGAPVAMPTIAYRPRPVELPTNALWLDISGVTNGVVTMRLQGTVPDTLYEILSQVNYMTNAGWQSEGVWIGTADQDWTETPVLVGTRTNQLFLRARSWKDEDGNGIPDWWEMQEFGATGVDGYADPDGDGWVNIQEYQNGTGPNGFNTPAAPQGVTVNYNAVNGAVSVNWLPSHGAVTGYVIERLIFETGQHDFFTVGAATTIHSETFPLASPSVRYSSPRYTVTASYSQGSSQPSTPTSLYDPGLSVYGRLVRDADNSLTLMVPPMGPQVTSLLLTRIDYQIFTIVPTHTRFTVGVSNLQSGTIKLPAAWTTNGGYSLWSQWWYVQGAADVGRQGEPVYLGSESPTDPFKDGRIHLRQNLNFLLRAANVERPFEYEVDFGSGSEFHAAGPDDYAYSDYYSLGRATWWGGTSMEQHKPFYDHYDYRNFVLTSTNVQSDGWLNTGVGSWFPDLTLYLPATFGYTPDFNATNVPTVLPLPGTRNILQIGAPADGEWPQLGISEIRTPTNLTLTLEANARNIYGLPYLSMKVARDAVTSNGVEIITVPAGTGHLSQGGYIYPEVANPVLQNVGYYFCNPNIGPFPGYTNFSTANQSPVLICGVADSTFQVAGHAKYAIANGYTNKFAYLGQYFEKGYKANSNGTRSTNETGILSPYGEFFATEPGKTFLTTKPDGVSTNIGECVVNAISMNVDANRDGMMDFSYLGPDHVSTTHPFRFWINDDDDWGDTGGNDLPNQGSAADALTATSGNDYRAFQLYAINGRRDLVDFSPVCLNIQSLVQALPPGPGRKYILKQADWAANIVYTDLSPTNCLAYLTDTNVAASMITNKAFIISPQGLILSSDFLQRIATNGNGVILVEGIRKSTSPLVLELWEGSGLIEMTWQGTNLLASTSLPLNFSGVEEMFRHKNLMPDQTSTNLHGPPDRLTDASVPNEPATNDKNFVFLHGYNVNPNQARGWQAETFKRMYWSGSQAKFYGVTWRASESQIGGSLTPNLQINIVNAFLTAPNFKDFLGTLTNGPTVVCGHSLGNLLALIALNDHDARMDKLLMIDAAVALEAVDGGTPVNTNMIHSDWLAYSPRLFAANWFRLFPTNDARSALTWSNRLANFRSTQVFNYYSSGEEVLREHTGPTPDFTGYVESTLINVLRGSAPAAAFSWAYQEKLKGRSPFNGILSSTHGGWKFNDWSYGTNNGHLLPPQANVLPDAQLRTNAFFDLTSSPTDIWDAILQIPSGNVYAQTQRNRILSDAIPALTLPAGANPVPKLTPQNGDDRNFNMHTQFKNGWPLGRSGDEASKWYHSDLREVAYTFVYKLFDDLTLKGDLK